MPRPATKKDLMTAAAERREEKMLNGSEWDIKKKQYAFLSYFNILKKELIL